MNRVFASKTARPPSIPARIAHGAADVLTGVHALVAGVQYLILVAQGAANRAGDAIETARDRAHRTKDFQ